MSTSICHETECPACSRTQSKVLHTEPFLDTMEEKLTLKCETCLHEFTHWRDLEEGMNIYPKTKCPKCNSKKLEAYNIKCLSLDRLTLQCGDCFHMFLQKEPKAPIQTGFFDSLTDSIAQLLDDQNNKLVIQKVKKELQRALVAMNTGKWRQV